MGRPLESRPVEFWLLLDSSAGLGRPVQWVSSGLRRSLPALHPGPFLRPSGVRVTSQKLSLQETLPERRRKGNWDRDRDQ